MNWSRGLFRSWIAISALWLAAAGAYLFVEWPEPIPAIQMKTEVCQVADRKSAEGKPLTSAEVICILAGPSEAEKERTARVRGHVLAAVQLAFFPPACLWLGGAAFLWVGRGFKIPKP